MRILDRYVVRQLFPAWLWCLLVFVFLGVFVDLFGRLDEIVRYHVSAATIARFYLSFLPIVAVQASPLALLLASAFITMRLCRYQELLAMAASGTSLLRAAVPIAFVGWVASIAVFLVSNRVVPNATRVYERMRIEVFRSEAEGDVIENVAMMDQENRLYHARKLSPADQELRDVIILEQDPANHPVRSLYADRAIWTKHGWLLLYGTVYHMGPNGTVVGEPERFQERLLQFPMTIRSFLEPEARPETMRYSQLRRLIMRMQETKVGETRRYRVDLAGKITLPMMSLLIALIGFAGSTQLQTRGNLRGLGLSLGWGMLYYLSVATCHALTKTWPIPVALGVWAPHAAALWWVFRRLKTVR